MRLPPKAREILEYLRTDEGMGDLVWSQPGGWWWGDQQTSGRTGFFLLHYILVSVDCETRTGRGTMTHFRINEEGRKALDDPAYVPESVRQGLMPPR